MIQKMKGTYDVIEDIAYVQAIEHKITQISKLFQFKEIRTPHFEARELFHRSVGATTDIVSKETYDFFDRGNREITLRPEGTAGVVRSYIENKLYTEHITPQKYYYVGAMFRYERPQKGRFREFMQFGAEAFGSDRPEMDVEIIAYAVTLLKALGIADVKVYLNSLGDEKSKENYQIVLKSHLENHIATLCSDCQTRFKTNPLRILDCKIDHEHVGILSAPKPLDFLTLEDHHHFEEVIRYLDAMQIDYAIDRSLVRGLDYYTHTVFEIKVSETLLGNQNTICGGGRYNNLVESLEGPKTPAVGFAFGIERLIIALKAAGIKRANPFIHAYVIILGDHARSKGLTLLQNLRLAGFIANTDFLNKSIKAQFKQADYHGARFVIIVGEEEALNDMLNINDQLTKESFKVRFAEVEKFLVNRLNPQSPCASCEIKGEEDDYTSQ